MQNRLKKLSMLQGKKRYLVFGLLALEVLSLPAAAQIVHRVAFDIRPVVTAVEIPTAEPGMSRFLVASNAGFSVKASNVVGDVSVAVHVSGTMSDVSRFGDAAQLPGPATGCAIASGMRSDIYVADRKTAASPGTPPQQAVIFEFKYDSDARPAIEFIPGNDDTSSLQKCQKATS